MKYLPWIANPPLVSLMRHSTWFYAVLQTNHVVRRDQPLQVIQKP